MGIPLPSGIDAAQRRFREIQAAVDNTGTRTLEAATISQGNLRVRHGGNIVIGDGGSLRITGGDLILGQGKIQGDALAEQFTAKTISLGSEKNSGKNPGAAWAWVNDDLVECPAWAQKTFIIASWYVQQTRSSSFDDTNFGAFARMRGGSQYSSEVLLNYEQSLDDGAYFRYAATGFSIFEVPGNTDFRLGVEGRATRAVYKMVGTVNALCLFTRNNS